MALGCSDGGRAAPFDEALPSSSATSASPTATPSTSSPLPSVEQTVSPPRPLRPPGVTKATPYRTVQALVADLTRAERAIRAGGASADLAHRQQRALRQLVTTPAWRAQAIAALPAELRDAARANVHAGAELYTFTKPRPALPEWRIVPAPPPAELRRYYDEAERRYGIDWTYLAAIHLVETRMGRLRGVSTAGARGPMQFLPSTWAEIGEGGDIEDPRDAILAAARYLVRRGRGDIRRGIRGYNPSDHYVEAVMSYASVMQAAPRAYDGYYHWQVHYRLASGDVILEEGYGT
jgi:membrane-bound lytic murein transglycosylase B